jgi:hypothetical protein
MRALILLFGLALIGASCVPEYTEVGEEELVAMELRAEVESIKVDFDNIRDRGVYVNNDGDRIGFPIYAEWRESKPIPGVSCSTLDTVTLCGQELPVVGDSLFKPKASREILINQIKEKRVDTILIVSRLKMQRAMAIKTRSPIRSNLNK